MNYVIIMKSCYHHEIMLQGSYAILKIDFQNFSRLNFSKWHTQVKYRHCNASLHGESKIINLM